MAGSIIPGEAMDSRGNSYGEAKDRPTVKSANEAREAVTGHNVRYVLGFGLAGIVLAFALVYALSFTWH
jgi:hypothetical protein